MTTSQEFQRLKTNVDKYNEEKERINKYITNKYNNDPGFKQMILERNREAYKRRKNASK